MTPEHIDCLLEDADYDFEILNGLFRLRNIIVGDDAMKEKDVIKGRRDANPPPDRTLIWSIKNDGKNICIEVEVRIGDEAISAMLNYPERTWHACFQEAYAPASFIMVAKPLERGLDFMSGLVVMREIADEYVNV